MNEKAEVAKLNPAAWVDDYGDYLFGFAIMRVRNRSVAEDLVQDTFLAAIKAQDRFEGRSKVKTWLTSILKNKITDFFRKAGRMVSETDLRFPGSEDAIDYDDIGHFRPDRMAQHWKTTAENDPVNRKEFWGVLQDCLDKLPDKVAQVFVAREIDGTKSPEVCSLFGITDSNLWVLLHRARKALRGCLEKNWFEGARNS